MCCWWWCSLGLKFACEKRSCDPEAVWIGTRLNVNSKNSEILDALQSLMDSSGGMVRHDEVRKLAGKESWVASFFPQLKPFVKHLWANLHKDDGSGDKVNLVFKRQVWPALSWLRCCHEHNSDNLVRHLYLVDRQLDGMIREGANTTGGGAAGWHGARRLSQQGFPNAFVATLWSEEDEQFLGVERGVPAHQATWEAFMALLAVLHFVAPEDSVGW